MKTGTVKFKYLMALMIVILLTLFCIAVFDNGYKNNGYYADQSVCTTDKTVFSETADTVSNFVIPETLTRDYIFLRSPNCVAIYQEYYAVVDKIGTNDYALLIIDKDGNTLYKTEGIVNVEKIAMLNDKCVFIKSGNALLSAVFADNGIAVINDISDTFADGIFDIFCDNGDVFVQDYNNSVYSLKLNGNSPETTQINLLKPYIANSIVRYYGGKFYSYRYTDETIYELTPNVTDGEKFAKIAVGHSDLYDYCIINGMVAILNKTRNKITLGGTVKEGNSTLTMACGNRKIIIGDAAAQNIEITDETLTPILKLASKSSGQGKLNEPQGIAVYDDTTLVADSGNKRVAKYHLDGELMAEYSLSHNVASVAAAKDGFYVNTGTEIFKYVYNSIGGASSVGEPIVASGVIDFAVWETSLIGLKSNGEVLDFATGSTLFVLPGANKLVINSHTNILYALSASKLARFNLGNRVNIEEYTHNMSGYIDFSVDYSGKIYIYYKDKIECYTMDKRQLSLNISEVYEVLGLSERYSAAQSHSGNVYIADTDRHVLLKIAASDIGAYSIYDYETPTEWNIVRGATYANGALMYVVPGNSETASNAAYGSRFLCLAEENANDGNKYYYGMDIESGSFYFVLANDVVILDFYAFEDNAPKYNSILAIGVDVYEYPFADAKVQNKADFSTLFTLVNNIAGEKEDLSWGWYKVAYTMGGVDYEGYVKIIDISPYSPLLPPAKQEYYKVKADNVGVTVNVYEQASTDSDILFTLNDGESVIVMSDQFDASSDFTKIYVNGKYGFIKTDNLIKDGLTTVEITAVIVGSICGAALLGTIPLFFVLYKKHHDRKKSIE